MADKKDMLEDLALWLVIISGLVHGASVVGINALGYFGGFAALVQAVVGVAAVYLLAKEVKLIK